MTKLLDWMQAERDHQEKLRALNETSDIEWITRTSFWDVFMAKYAPYQRRLDGEFPFPANMQDLLTNSTHSNTGGKI